MDGESLVCFHGRQSLQNNLFILSARCIVRYLVLGMMQMVTRASLVDEGCPLWAKKGAQVCQRNEILLEKDTRKDSNSTSQECTGL